MWQVALLDLRINASRRWPATRGVLDFRSIEPAWLREVVKDWARATRPYLQRLRETLRACQTASHTLTAAGRTDPSQPRRRRLHPPSSTPSAPSGEPTASCIPPRTAT